MLPGLLPCTVWTPRPPTSASGGGRTSWSRRSWAGQGGDFDVGFWFLSWFLTLPVPLSLLFSRWLALAGLIRHIHAAQHVVSEKEFSIRRHHHDLQFVRQPLGHDFVDQQRILLQDRRLALQSFRICGRRHANAVRFRISQQLPPFRLRFAVDDLGLCLRFRILQGRFFPRLRLQLALLNLFFFQRQRVLHSVRLSLRLQNVNLRFSLSLLDLLHFGGFRLQF